MQTAACFQSLHAFLEVFDKPGNIILLEGKRNVLADDADKLRALGTLLARESIYMRFRSGNASGSDEIFSRGVAEVDPSRLELIKPYASHRKTALQGSKSYSMDDVNLAAEPEVVYHSRQQPQMAGLVDKYMDQVRNRLTMKAAYILRDTVKVIGTQSGISPASVALFYDDLSNPLQGGTGHTISVCKNLLVPYCDQRVWMQWL